MQSRMGPGSQPEARRVIECTVTVTPSFVVPDNDAVAQVARNAFSAAMTSGSALDKSTPGSPNFDAYAAAAANPLVQYYGDSALN